MSFTAEQEVALHLCGTEQRRIACSDRIQQLLSEADFGELRRVLEWQRVFGLVGRRLRESYPGLIPDEFAKALDQDVLAARGRGLLIDHLSTQVSQSLEAKGIPAVTLKGPTLGQRIYGDVGVRAPSSDIDLLVQAEHLDDAMELVKAAGYAPYDDVQWAGGLPHYHYGLAMTGPFAHRLELHWRVHWYEKQFGADTIERSRITPGGERRLEPVDELATLLLIFARDGFVGLRLAADVAAFWDSHERELPPAALDGILAAYPQLRQVLLAAMEVVERWTGLPADALRSKSWGRGVRARTAVRLANWTGRGDEHDVSTNITLIDLLLTPRGAGRTFLRHYYFQPVDHYRLEYGWPRERRLVNQTLRLAHIAARVPKSIGQYARRLWVIRAGRSWAALP